MRGWSRASKSAACCPSVPSAGGPGAPPSACAKRWSFKRRGPSLGSCWRGSTRRTAAPSATFVSCTGSTWTIRPRRCARRSRTRWATASPTWSGSRSCCSSRSPATTSASPRPERTMMATTTTDDDLDQLCTSLKLKQISKVLERELTRAEQQGATVREVLARLLREEYLYRREQSMKYRIDQADLPER